MQFSTTQAVVLNSGYQNISDSALIHTGPGNLQGIIINSNSGGQIKIWDSLAASGSVLANTTVLSNFAVTGERTITYFGARFLTGLYIQVVAGTVDLTVVHNY